ncbi:hypothetical protein B0T19DRAFT_297073 [Cercophora scortea]|uniref:Uncharacterized protein n=1 Tax=Cercophora scortea TaxID=314031 RepID=A0AAE0I3S1_9PEZI|nr:hypothetical protein B0T19DRAFT_297073 [Cercophora scortea]
MWVCLGRILGARLFTWVKIGTEYSAIVVLEPLKRREIVSSLVVFGWSVFPAVACQWDVELGQRGGCHHRGPLWGDDPKASASRLADCTPVAFNHVNDRAVVASRLDVLIIRALFVSWFAYVFVCLFRCTCFSTFHVIAPDIFLARHFVYNLGFHSAQLQTW